MAAVERAELITCPDEAREFYLERLARSHEITRYDRKVVIVFERGATHLFSKDEKEDPEDIPEAERVVRKIGPNRFDVRRFNLDRARLMDRVLPALSDFTVSVEAQGGNVLVYGPALPDGRYMRVALRHGPGTAMTVVSAYPVSEYLWKDARRSKAARFPP